MPLVTIIVPIYNVEKYLSECLECLINQSYKNLEIICINDGSKDNSLEILEEYSKKDNRIKIFSQENKGEAATRNQGLELATGKYIAAIDSDDYCSLDFVEECVKVAEQENSDIVIPFMNIRQNIAKRDVKTFSYFCAVQLFVKRELILNNPDIRYNPKIKMGPDAIFSHLLLTTTDKISKEYNSKYFYRQHQNQISANMVKQAQKYIDSIDIWFEEITQYYNNHNIWIKYNNHLVNVLCELPFTAYLRLDLNIEQKEYIFNKIQDFIKEHNLSIQFDYSNKRVAMFKRFLKCKNWKQFEFYWLVSHYYLKFIDFTKQLKNI